MEYMGIITQHLVEVYLLRSVLCMWKCGNIGGTAMKPRVIILPDFVVCSLRRKPTSASLRN